MVAWYVFIIITLHRHSIDKFTRCFIIIYNDKTSSEFVDTIRGPGGFDLEKVKIEFFVVSN